MIKHEVLDELSVTGQLLKDVDPEIVPDIIRIIQRAELRRGLTPFSIFIELKKALFFFRLNHPESPIVDIHIGADLIGFQIFLEVIKLTPGDIRKLANTPVD